MSKERYQKLLARAEESGNEKQVEYFTNVIKAYDIEKEQVCFAATPKKKTTKKGNK